MAGEAGGARGFPACGQMASLCVPIPVSGKGREEENGVGLDPAWVWAVWIWGGWAPSGPAASVFKHPKSPSLTPGCIQYKNVGTAARHGPGECHSDLTQGRGGPWQGCSWSLQRDVWGPCEGWLLVPSRDAAPQGP